MTDHAMQYGVAELVINAFLLLTALTGCGDLMLILIGILALVGMVVNVVLLGVGFGWFKALTGYTIFEMNRQLGSNYWLSLPLLQGAMYFNLWFTFVSVCIGAGGLAISAIGFLCSVPMLCIAGLTRKEEEHYNV
ncbi:hypothetical protein BGW37DRAFT_497146 [Umbelopsis sp. PMI_123]|nr:hypothetical protein BGW37DRAFT_497146 [Umbelopsis sp. PMI_123]